MKALGIVLLFVACTPAVPAADEPVWGKQACSHCAMLVGDRASAAQVQLENGRHLFFDDVGCLVSWEARQHPPVKARWVRDANATRWIDPAQARFATGRPTPMDFGFLAADAGLSFDEVRAAVASRSENPR